MFFLPCTMPLGTWVQWAEKTLHHIWMALCMSVITCEDFRSPGDACRAWPGPLGFVDLLGLCPVAKRREPDSWEGNFNTTHVTRAYILTRCGLQSDGTGSFQCCRMSWGSGLVTEFCGNRVQTIHPPHLSLSPCRVVDMTMYHLSLGKGAPPKLTRHERQ